MRVPQHISTRPEQKPMAKIKLTKEQRARLKRMADQGLIAYNPKRVGGETKVGGQKAGGDLTTQEVDRLRRLDRDERTKAAFGPKVTMKKAKPKKSPFAGMSDAEIDAQKRAEDEALRVTRAIDNTATAATVASLITALTPAGPVVWAGKKIATKFAKDALKKKVRKIMQRKGRKFAKDVQKKMGKKAAKPVDTKPSGPFDALKVKPKAAPKKPAAEKPRAGIEFAPAARITGAQAKKLLTKAGVPGVSKMSAAQAVSALKKLKSAKEAAKKVAKKATAKKKPAAKAKPKTKPKRKLKLVPDARRADGTISPGSFASTRLKDAGIKGVDKMSEAQQRTALANLMKRSKGANKKPAAKPKAAKAPKAPKAAKAPAPKTAPAKAAAPAEGNLAKQLGYKGAAVQKALNAFFKGQNVTNLNEAIAKAAQLERSLNRIPGSKVSGKGLRKKIDKITTTKQPGMKSARPKSKDARAPVAEEGAKREAARMKRARGDMRTERLKVAEDQAPRVQAVKGRVKGIRQILKNVETGKITPEQAEKSMGTLLSKAPAPLAAEIRRLMRAAQDMGIAARKATGAQLKSLKADQGKAVAQLNKLIMSLLVTAGLGASAE
jgi:hypothetical protein